MSALHINNTSTSKEVAEALRRLANVVEMTNTPCDCEKLKEQLAWELAVKQSMSRSLQELQERVAEKLDYQLLVSWILSEMFKSKQTLAALRYNTITRLHADLRTVADLNQCISKKVQEMINDRVN